MEDFFVSVFMFFFCVNFVLLDVVVFVKLIIFFIFWIWRLRLNKVLIIRIWS